MTFTHYTDDVIQTTYVWSSLLQQMELPVGSQHRCTVQGRSMATAATRACPLHEHTQSELVILRCSCGDRVAFVWLAEPSAERACPMLRRRHALQIEVESSLPAQARHNHAVAACARPWASGDLPRRLILQRALVARSGAHSAAGLAPASPPTDRRSSFLVPSAPVPGTGSQRKPHSRTAT
jgi:hypothetical protein